jgi:hypothetical protein
MVEGKAAANKTRLRKTSGEGFTKNLQALTDLNRLNC